MRKTLSLALILFVSSRLFAQQDPQYSLFMFNKQVLNPGYVGAAGSTELIFDGRSQWVGIDGHPNTFTFSFNQPINILRGGWGLHFVKDVIGPFDNNHLRLSYAFKIPIGESGTAIQLGINPGLMFGNLNGIGFRPETPGDPVLQNLTGQSVSSGAKFDLGGGVYFYKPPQNDKENGEKFFVGLSSDHLLQPKIDKWGSSGGGSEQFTLYRIYTLMGGYRFDFRNSPISLVPSIFFKMSDPQKQLDLNMNLHIRPMVFGLSYRGMPGLTNSDAVAGIMGFHINQRLFAAYSYDYSLSGLSNATSGSHEIIIRYVFPRIVKIYPPDLDVKQNPSIR